AASRRPGSRRRGAPRRAPPGWTRCGPRVRRSLTVGVKCASPWQRHRFAGRRLRAMEDVPEHLSGRTAPWGRAAGVVLAVLVARALWLRLRGLSAEGFGDDEVQKWLAANRYLHGVFSGDDVEHPMLMKWLIAATIAAGAPLGWAPETMTRLPNALAGGAGVLVVALLGRRLFGRTAGLLSAALAACSVTLIGYQRVAKEDTLLGIFLMLLLWCMAEAKAAADGARVALLHGPHLPQPPRVRPRWNAALVLCGVRGGEARARDVPLRCRGARHRVGAASPRAQADAFVGGDLVPGAFAVRLEM